MSCTRSKIVAQAQAWVGLNEADGSHKQIIDIYNSHKPWARGYKLKYTDSWCSGTISALAIACGATDIIPTEVGCEKHIALFKNLGIWVEDDSFTPLPGDIMFYDWDDSGKGDNKGHSDHVGIVEKVNGDTITVIEGNYSNSVKRRTLKVNSKYIRGYGVPKYDKETAVKVYKPSVKEWQIAAIADGFKFPEYGADGKWGAECEAVAKKAVVKKRVFYINKNLTKIVQRVLGFTGDAVDGKCGKDTDAAIYELQKTLFPDDPEEWDRAVGLKCWKKILGVK